MMQTIKEIAIIIGIFFIVLFLGGYIQENGIVPKDLHGKAIFNFNSNCKTNEH